MGNNDKWIDIKTPEDALEWFKEGQKNESGKTKCSRMQVKDNVFDRDSGPEAWEHFDDRYNLGLNQKSRNWLRDGSKKRAQTNELFKSISPGRIVGILDAKDFLKYNYSKGESVSLILGGDTDFNFKSKGSKKRKSKVEEFAEKMLKEETINAVFSKEGYTVEIEEDKISKLIDETEKNYVNLLKNCHDMHHTLLNFSLMQVPGGLNNFKGSLCDYDRLDRFVFFLDRYYNTPIADRRNTPIAIAAEIANRSCLIHYLNQFSKDSEGKDISADKCIYNYCAKIYFLPTEGYLTGMMNCMIKENKINDNNKEWEEDWVPLLKTNKELIDKLIKSGANDFKENTPSYAEYNKKLAIDYMLLAVRFWQAKERYFELMDKIIDSKTAE